MTEDRDVRIFSLVRATVALVALVTTPLAAHATVVTFSASDAIGDHVPSSIDLTGFRVSFDNQSGRLETTLDADTANPFFGRFAVGLLLPTFGPGTTEPYVEFEFDLSQPVSSLVLDPTLLSVFTGLAPGDEVASYTGGFFWLWSTAREPSGRLPFRLAVFQTLADAAAAGNPVPTEYDVLDAQQVTVTGVPLPATGWLLSLGLALTAVRQRRR
ncbi:MAG: VPLPA-CTERM sorting domain-containing protein [Gammaproteobacteria bacterium]|nr:VPLPA-CTERM sorting domain-containing protein [Gammaproteobacteria bacterium]